MNVHISKRSAARALAAAAIAVGVAGCDSNAASRSAPVVAMQESVPQSRTTGDGTFIRHQLDAVRNRIWVLAADGVALYDASTGEDIAQIPLPGWVWAGEKYSCAPDLALGPRGEAVISSNVVPTLWRVDPVTLAASRHEPALGGNDGKDVGFTGLAYSAQQRAYFAVSGMHGSMWRIDSSLQRAQNIPLSEPLPNACGLAMRLRAADQRSSRFTSLCVRADKEDWSVNLAPDQRSGYVRPGRCMG